MFSQNPDFTNTERDPELEALIVMKLDALKSYFMDNLIQPITKTNKAEFLKKVQDYANELKQLKELMITSRQDQNSVRQQQTEQMNLFERNNFMIDGLPWDRKLSWNQQQGDYSIGDPFTMDFETDIHFSLENLSNFEVEVEKEKDKSPRPEFNTLDFKDENALYGIENLEANAFDGEMIFMRSDSLYDFSY
jgi:hypothetical protein